MTISEKQIDVEGLATHYLESGEDNGRAMLLLHGGIGDARTTWHQVLPPLAQKYHVIAPDLPGFGNSAPLPEPCMETFIHWLHALLDGLGQTDAVILGSFVGALLARLFAASEPQYVPALILVDGGTIPKYPSYLPALMRLPVLGDMALRLSGHNAYAPKPLDRIFYVKDALSDGLREASHANASAFASLLRVLVLAPMPEKQTPLVPTLLLWGANDPMMPLEQGERLQAEIPGAVLEPIADCGHMPQLEASEAFVFQITSFLDKLSRARQPRVPGVGMLRSD